MAKLRVYSTPPAMIDVRQLSILIREDWNRPVDLRDDLGCGQSTAMALWHGTRAVGSIWLLMVCSRLGINPCTLLVER